MRTASKAALGALLLSGCSLGQIAANLPVIREFPPTFTSTSPAKVFAATITQQGDPIDPALRVVCQVSLQTTPTAFGPEFDIIGTRLAGAAWNCTLPAGLSASVRPNQSLRFRWQVFSGLTKVAETEYRDAQLDCPGGVAAAMTAEQNAVVGRFGGLSTVAQITAAGFIPSHGFASLRGLGIAFVRATDGPSAVSLAQAGPPVAGSPNLLLFGALPGRDVNDVALPDEPYTLIGWAYAQPIRSDRALPQPPTGAVTSQNPPPVQRRPVLACIPHHEWMIHSAGTHLPDGRFQTGVGVGLPHTALWDIHIWRTPAGTPARISLLAPTDVPGLASPDDAFFYPTAYD